MAMRWTRASLLLAALVAVAPPAPPPARAESPSAARPADRRVEIINETGVALTELYATNIGVEGWGEDRLGDRVLHPNERVTLDFDDGSGACWFDLRAVFDDGDVVVRRNFNVCKETGWRLFERRPAEAGQRI